MEDPWAPALAQAAERGFSREEAAMALAVLGMTAAQQKVWFGNNFKRTLDLRASQGSSHGSCESVGCPSSLAASLPV